MVGCEASRRLAARITHIVHPDRAVEFNIVGLDLLGDGVDFEDVYAADGERDEVEAPAPEHLGAEMEDVHGVNCWARRAHMADHR